jgi:hypothetical protein
VTAPDRQVVVALLAGTASDAATSAAAADLAAKAIARGLASPVLALSAGAPAAPEPALGALETASRLYLVGATGHDQQEVGGFAPGPLAQRLVTCGLRRVGRISVVADGVALPAGCAATDGDAPPADASRSFAGTLHRELGARGVRTELVARPGTVRVLGAAAGPDRGRKVTRDGTDAPWRHAAPRSKLVWRWDGLRQTVSWAPARGSQA